MNAGVTNTSTFTSESTSLGQKMTSANNPFLQNHTFHILHPDTDFYKFDINLKQMKSRLLHDRQIDLMLSGLG